MSRPSLPPGVLVGDLRAAARAMRRHAFEQPARLLSAHAAVHQQMADRASRSLVLARRVHELLGLPPRRSRTPTVNRFWETVDRDPRCGRVPLLATSVTSVSGSNHVDGLVEPVLYSASHALLSSLQSALHALAVCSRSGARRAIAEHLEQQRARLATSLLQPGLFDRRAERAAAARTRRSTKRSAAARVVLPSSSAIGQSRSIDRD